MSGGSSWSGRGSSARRSRGRCRAKGFVRRRRRPAPVGSGATAAGMGHLPVMDDSEAQFALCRYSQSLWDEAADGLPPAVEFDRCGTLWVAADDEEMAEVHRKKATSTTSGAWRRTSSIREALAEAEPNLRPGLAGGWSCRARR